MPSHPPQPQQANVWADSQARVKARFKALPLCWPPGAQAERNTALCFMRLIQPWHMICYKIRNRLLRLFETFCLSSNTRELQEACLVFQSKVWMLLSRLQRKSTEWSKEEPASFSLSWCWRSLQILTDLYRSLQAGSCITDEKIWLQGVVVPRLHPIRWNTFFSILLQLH